VITQVWPTFVAGSAPRWMTAEIVVRRIRCFGVRRAANTANVVPVLLPEYSSWWLLMPRSGGPT
jgi:hypothetical protein